MLIVMVAWKSSREIDCICTRTSNFIRQVTKEVLGVSMCNFDGHRWDLTREVQVKVTTKKIEYMVLAERKNEEDKRNNWEIYKMTNKKVKIAVMGVRIITFEHL